MKAQGETVSMTRPGQGSETDRVTTEGEAVTSITSEKLGNMICCLEAGEELKTEAVITGFEVVNKGRKKYTVSSF